MKLNYMISGIFSGFRVKAFLDLKKRPLYSFIRFGLRNLTEIPVLLEALLRMAARW